MSDAARNGKVHGVYSRRRTRYLETKLEASKSYFGFVPTLRATTAESPELLAGHSAVWDLLSIQKAA
jgi:hypothetical protein